MTIWNGEMAFNRTAFCCRWFKWLYDFSLGSDFRRWSQRPTNEFITVQQQCIKMLFSTLSAIMRPFRKLIQETLLLKSHFPANLSHNFWLTIGNPSVNAFSTSTNNPNRNTSTICQYKFKRLQIHNKISDRLQQKQAYVWDVFPAQHLAN